MTFAQWAASKHFKTTPGRLAVEAIWNALIGGGYSPSQVSIMLVDLLDNFRERNP